MKLLIFLWIVLLLPSFCQAQPVPPVTSVEVGSDPESFDSKKVHERAQNKGAYSLRVRYLKVEGRWAGQVELPLKVGDLLTPESLSQAMNALKDEITRDPLQGYNPRAQGEVGVLYIDVDFDRSPLSTAPDNGADSVGIIFNPYYLHVSLLQVGDNVLPIPRSALATFYKNVPKPLLVLNPTVGVSHDRAFGTALGGSFTVDLLNLPEPGRMSASANDNRHLDIRGQGMKSVDEPFYRVDTGLRYSAKQSGRILQEFSLLAEYNGVKEPLGEDQHTRHAGIGGVGVMLKLAPKTRLSLDTRYRWTQDKLDAKLSALSMRTVANEQANRLLFEAIPRPMDGFLRAVLWGDNGWLTKGGNSYQRFAGRLGYAKEIPVMQNQTIGLELLAGGGRVWNATPAYAHFFGGNAPGQFLYDSPSSATLLNMPTGPLIRSFGEGQAGFRTSQGVNGGNAFWNVNLNLTFPIPPWSRPLIPNELTDLADANGNPVSLKQLLRRQIDVTGPNMLAATLRTEGLSSKEAEEQARIVFEEVKPASHFLIDYANLYSIKPLLMFDAGGLQDNGGNETWLAAGGGVQLTIVIAKLEAGYMHTVSGPTFGSRGNAFFRLVFQNLF